MKKYIILFLMIFMLVGCQNNNSVNEIEIFKEGLIAVEKEGRYGYINKKGETVIDFYYERAGAFKNGIAVVVISFGKYNIIDKKGNILLPKNYQFLEIDNNTGLIIYRENFKYGVINSKGKIISQPFYDYVDYKSGFQDGLLLVEINNKYGFINKKGEMIVHTIYEKAYSFKRGLARVKQNGKFGYINNKGKVVINFFYEEALDFDNNDRAIVNKSPNTSRELIDKKGNTTFSKKDIEYGGGNYYIAYNDNNKKYEVHDKDGEKVDSLEFDYYNTFFENNASVNIDGESLNILFDDNGQLIKSLPINESLFLYNYNVEWTLSVLPYLVEYSDSIFSIHTLNGKTILIEGEEIIQTVIDKMFIVKRNGKYGVVDTNDNIKIPFIYDGLFYTGDGYFVTSINNKMGVLDSKGKVIINAEYDEIYPFVSLNTFY